MKARLTIGEGYGSLKVGSAVMDLHAHERLIGSDCIDKIIRQMYLRIMGERLRKVEFSRGAIMPLEHVERLYIENVLANRNGDTLEEVAGQLGITKRTLFNRRREYGLPIRKRNDHR